MSYQDPPHEFFNEEAQKKRADEQQKIADKFKTLFPQKAIPEGEDIVFDVETQKSQLEEMEKVLREKLKI